jgi:hypothetical protein
VSESYGILTFGDQDQPARRARLLELMRESPIPDDEQLLNLGLFLTPQALSRVLFMDFLYRQIVETQGVVLDLGCRWGQNAALFCALRGVYEPFNRLRKVVAFDTFGGFPDTLPQDGPQMRPGGYAVAPGYETRLNEVLAIQEAESPLSHLRRFEVVKGDASRSLEAYLERNPETIVALAYFDFDLYEPTHRCLSLIRDRLTRGSVLGFDEINAHECPGETLALKEVFGLDRYRIRRHPFNARSSYLVVE